MSRKKSRKKIPFQKQYQTRITQPSSKGLNYLIGLLSIIVLIFASSTVLKVVTGEATSPPDTTSYLRIQVLNGCGIHKAAASMGDIIRSADIPNVRFDIIEEDNFKTFEVSETIILTRDERATDDAVRLAEVLGVKREDVIYQGLQDNFLGIDLTIVVGSDFKQIAERAGVKNH